MIDLLNIILMAPQQGQKGNGGGSSMWIMLILLIVIFWLFFIRPQSKKAKDQKKYRDSLKKGDKVITIGGIHGKILEVKDTTLVIETEGQNRLKIEKSAVSMDNTGQLSEKK